GVSHLAYLIVPSDPVHLCPFASARSTCGPCGWLSHPQTTMGTPSPWGSRPVGDPAFRRRVRSNVVAGVSFVPLNDLIDHRSSPRRLPCPSCIDSTWGSIG